MCRKLKPRWLSPMTSKKDSVLCVMLLSLAPDVTCELCISIRAYADFRYMTSFTSDIPTWFSIVVCVFAALSNANKSILCVTDNFLFASACVIFPSWKIFRQTKQTKKQPTCWMMSWPTDVMSWLVLCRWLCLLDPTLQMVVFIRSTWYFYHHVILAEWWEVGFYQTSVWTSCFFTLPNTFPPNTRGFQTHKLLEHAGEIHMVSCRSL